MTLKSYLQIKLGRCLIESTLKDHVEDDPDLQAVIHSVSKHTVMSEKKKEKLMKAIHTDETFRTLHKFCRDGWPSE